MRTRIRSIKPEFFQYEALYDAEQQCGLPLRLAFSGLWCVADREGRFEWRPRALKANVLPYDQVDFDAVLDQLARCGCILKYIVAGREYGVIPSWGKHQVIHHTERASDLPAPSEVTSNGADTVDSPLPHGDIPGISRRGREGKGRELEGKGTTTTTSKALVAPKNGATGEAIMTEFQQLLTTQHLNGAARTAKAKLVFAYWAAKWDHPTAVYDGKRRSRLEARLKENGDNVSELLWVIDGAKRDDWTDRGKYAGIEQLFRDRGAVERLAGMAPGFRNGEPHPMAVKYAGVPEKPHAVG